MICREYRDSIGLLVDGELSEDAALGVRAHLAVCSGCREEFEVQESLVASLSLEHKDGLAIEESRFWRRFEHDLALKAARGDTPFWSHSIALPFPLAILSFAVFVAISVVALQSYNEVQVLQVQHRALEASLKSLYEESLFVKEPRMLAETISTPAERIVAPTPAASGNSLKMTIRSVPESTLNDRNFATDPRTRIQFIDATDDVTGDLY